MAAPQPGQNQVYLFRLQTLIIDGSTTVIRNIFYQKCSNVPLHVFLSQEKKEIDTLRTKKKIINDAQFYLLYPQGGNPPSVTDIDLTLAICLLRNLKCFGLDTQFNWRATPQPGDTSLEADLCRLRNTRNEIAHIASTVEIKQETFQKKWTEIEQVLLRLNTSVPNPVQNLQQKIDGYKNNPLDPEAEKKIHEEIKMLQRLEEDLDNLDKEVQIVKNKVEDVIENVEDVKERVEKANENIEEVKKRTEETFHEVHEVKEELKMQRKKAEESEVSARREPSMFRRLQEKIQMRGKKKDMKEDLIALYRQQYHTLPLSPLIEEQDTPLLKFYVMPDINTVEHQRTLGGGSEIKSEVTSLHDVFQKKSKTCREIYLTAHAGFGKTAFSKRLVLTWCQAKNDIKGEQKHFKEEDIRAMSEFKFVFLLSLRECSEECDIDEMIMKQIIPRLANTSVTLSNLETILRKEKCLVILDGLDEWSHPMFACKQGPSDIPHRKARDCTILTTTRPWKLSVISLSSSQIEQKLEIVGLNETSANGLKKSVISLLRDESDREKHIQDFNSAVQNKGLSDLETVPLLLMYLLCLWCDGIDLGRSKCELYCQIVELLLKRTFKKYPVMQHAGEQPQSDIPPCFSEYIHSKNNYSLLKGLAKLAYERLFDEHKENTLAFDQSDAEKYLTQDNFQLSLHSGILTQSKEVKLTKQSSKVSFCHKTVQEYFCAMHLSCQNESDVKKIILQNCRSIQNILDMSEVFFFIIGMNAKMISLVSRELMPVISADKITSTYRSMTRYDYRYADHVKEIQNMYISCFKENLDNNDLKLFCQDFIIDEDCWEESHFTNFKQLAKHNKNNMQSIYIENTGICSLHEIIESCGLVDLFNIRKIYLEGECKEEDMLRLLNRSLECITVISREWQDDHFIPKYSFCSSELCQTFQNNSLLQAIYIYCFKMEHRVLEQFLNYIIERKSMAEINLHKLYCISHRSTCPGFNLDFTQHSHLRTLGLHEVPVTQLEVNVSELRFCDVGQLSKPGIATSYLRSLQAARKLHSFQCSYLESSGEIEALQQTLPKLVTVKEVKMRYISLGERSLSLSPEMENIELVWLLKVTMSTSTLRGVVSVLEKLPHTVIVDLRDCNIRPETDFEHVKRYIKTSQNFVVTFDGMFRNMSTFVFQTKKS